MVLNNFWSYTILGFMVLNNFWSYTIFCGQNVILLFKTTCTWDKKLWCGLVRNKNLCFSSVICLLWCGLARNKNLCFSPVICLQFVLSLKLFYKWNPIQLELPCHVLHFWTNQTHPKSIIYQSFIDIANI